MYIICLPIWMHKHESELKMPFIRKSFNCSRIPISVSDVTAVNDLFSAYGIQKIDGDHRTLSKWPNLLDIPLPSNTSPIKIVNWRNLLGFFIAMMTRNLSLEIHHAWCLQIFTSAFFWGYTNRADQFALVQVPL